MNRKPDLLTKLRKPLSLVLACALAFASAPAAIAGDNDIADLSITITNGVASVTPGDNVTYTITASNAGPVADTGATVACTLPPMLTNATWTGVGANGGTCAAAGMGDISDTVNLPVNGSVTYTVSASVDLTAVGALIVTANVSASIPDNNPSNNSATDIDSIMPGLIANPMPTGVWQNTDILVTLGVVGIEGQPDSGQYALTQSSAAPGAGEYVDYTGSVTISDESGFNYLHYQVAQGQEQGRGQTPPTLYEAFGPYQIDKTAPNFSQGYAPEAMALSHSEISLYSWATDGLSGVASYRWQYAQTPGGPYTDVPGGDTDTCTHAGLATNTTYYYILHVTDNAGNVLTAGEISATTLREPDEADADNNTITLSTFNPTAGEPFNFTAAGDGQNNAGGVEGDTRFVPQDWSVNPSGTFPLGGPYAASVVLSAPGTYTLRVVFRLEQWSDGAWRDTGTTDVKSASLYVWAEESILDVPQTGDGGARWFGWVLLCAPLAIAAAALLRRRRAA